MAEFVFAFGSVICLTLRPIGLATGDCYDRDGMVVLGGLSLLLASVVISGAWVLMRR